MTCARAWIWATASRYSSGCIAVSMTTRTVSGAGLAAMRPRLWSKSSRDSRVMPRSGVVSCRGARAGGGSGVVHDTRNKAAMRKTARWPWAKRRKARMVSSYVVGYAGLNGYDPAITGEPSGRTGSDCLSRTRRVRPTSPSNEVGPMRPNQGGTACKRPWIPTDSLKETIP